jgi:hypothetical protein
MLNYLYALGEFECRLALIAIGLDPGLGFAHKDAPYRDSAALDILEAIRPSIDRYVLQLMRERTFSCKEFVELPNGQVRLGSELAKLLAEAVLGECERAVAPIVEKVARLVAGSASSPVTVRTRLTQADRKRARAGSKHRRRSTAIPSACRSCGVVLENREREYCDECLPGFQQERAEKLVKAARTVLAEMRASPDDPAKSPEARAKKVAAAQRHERAKENWERTHGKGFDEQRYEREILPRLHAMTVPQLASATGLSKYYCWQVRQGGKRLHPRHWLAVTASSRRRS